jgi:hypothetical protein
MRIRIHSWKIAKFQGTREEGGEEIGAAAEDTE